MLVSTWAGGRVVLGIDDCLMPGVTDIGMVLYSSVSYVPLAHSSPFYLVFNVA
jgi:hypothetical protein